MKSCKQTASMGAAATDEADSKFAAKSDAIQSRKGNKAKGKLAVKSNGAEKPKTHDFSDVTRGLAAMSIISAEEKLEDERLGLMTYKDIYWRTNFKDVYDRPSVDAIREEAAEKWIFFSDSDKAPYIAYGRETNALVEQAFYEYRKTLKVTRMMMNLKM